MPLGTPFVIDTVPNLAGGTVGNLTPAQLSTVYGAGNVRTASKAFAIHHRGHVVHFPKGVPVVVDAALIATLTAAGAPVS